MNFGALTTSDIIGFAVVGVIVVAVIAAMGNKGGSSGNGDNQSPHDNRHDPFNDIRR